MSCPTRAVCQPFAELGLDLCQRRIRVVVEFEVHRDGTEALRAGRLHVVDAVRARDHTLERRRNEAAYEVGVRADVGGRDHHDGDVASGVLSDGERSDRLEPGDQDHQVDDNRQDGPSDEEIGEFHQLSSGLGAGLLPGWILLLTSTAAPLRSLKTPEVTISSPALMPEVTAT